MSLKVKILVFSTLLCLKSFSQDADKFIYTKDGRPLAQRKSLIIQCRKGYAAPPDNKIVTQLCECQVDLLNKRYTLGQIKKYERLYRGNGLSQIMAEDTLLQRQMKECTNSNGAVLLLKIPEYRQSFVTKCIDNLKMNFDKPLNDTLAALYCNCAADILEKRKLTLEKFDDLSDPSSLIYNEVAFKCGSPYLEASDFAKDWKASNLNDIQGPAVDTVQVISVMGMHKIKIRIGNELRIWMIDSGASDLLVSDEYAKTLKSNGILTEINFMGEGLYSLADNRVVSCKRYKIDSVRIGHCVINNVIISVSKSAKEFLLGKSMLNKFSEWSIDNKNNLLILKK
jgi:hypothetical protein